MKRPTKIDDKSLREWLAAHPGWEATQAGGQEAIARAFKFANFSEALAFVVQVGLAAERKDHHPDVELGWGRARIVWTTHDQKGVTSLDLELASATDAIA